MDRFRFVSIMLLFLVSLTLGDDTSERRADPNWLGTPALISLQGLPQETHQVTTEDGYILTMHRIPNPGKPVIFMLHGLMSNSGCFVANLRNNTLSFLLYDAGYDIWLINFRGTIYSRSHVNYTTDSKQFWEYSWTQEGIYDIPAGMDYIKDVTGQSKATLAVHSQGTAAALTMLSLRPDFSARVPLILAFAPAVYIKHTKCPGVHLFNSVNALSALETVHIWHINVLPLKYYLPEWICTHFSTLCELTLSEMMGWDLSNLNKHRMGIYVDVIDEVSTHNLHHGFQVMESGIFRQYDWGEYENMKKYGQKTPPQYPIQDIHTPIAIYYGGHDKMVVPEDVEQMLIPSLKQEVFLQAPVLVDHWSHVGPVLGWEADESRNAVELVIANT